jgi:hypothetical protein
MEGDDGGKNAVLIIVAAKIGRGGTKPTYGPMIDR